MSRWLIPGSNARTAPTRTVARDRPRRRFSAPVLLTTGQIYLAQPASSKRGSEDKGRTDISKAKPVSGAKKLQYWRQVLPKLLHDV
ncbi:unnamed protein product [Acanthoscelides obtectus]|uniref:Uncharacterized protein n=1 Tax=Acanthoscelides obtectus TaxID=200917 RepID=A0A9P0VVE7_ACAOB|nr:unnamed protein product [Acanthoscelides obtectus]CAH2021868.1 unnamed protein product [Acanthoscelides obtectus]CAK1686471.1 hypothetical protein AOBTE_LOCUS35976 [Acanthoscelides obtectus]CAK1686907.1 hypothetical protein AOBTE_LOCUS36140 [Acanthoscelides obtectus]